MTGANNEPVLQKKKRKNKGKEILPPADFEALVMQEPEVNEYVLLLNFILIFFLHVRHFLYIRSIFSFLLRRIPETEQVKGKKRKKNRDKSETEMNQEPECKKIKASQSVPTADDSREETVISKDSSSVKQKKKKKLKETPTQEVEISSNKDSIVPVSNGSLMSSAESEKNKTNRNSDSNTPYAVGVTNSGEASSPKKKKKKKSAAAATATLNANSTGTVATDNKKKKKKKKKKKRNNTAENSTAAQSTGRLSGVVVKKNKMTKKPIKASQGVDPSIVQSMSDDRLKLYGIPNPKRFKQAARYGFGRNK